MTRSKPPVRCVIDETWNLVPQLLPFKDPPRVEDLLDALRRALADRSDESWWPSMSERPSAEWIDAIERNLAAGKTGLAMLGLWNMAAAWSYHTHKQAIESGRYIGRRQEIERRSEGARKKRGGGNAVLAAMHVEHLIREGKPPREARKQALERYHGVTPAALRQACHRQKIAREEYLRRETAGLRPAGRKGTSKA